MKRDDILVEVMTRLYAITQANGYTFDISYVFRNPEEEPDPRRMPCINLFELPDVTQTERKRGASLPPVYAKEFTLILEMWYVSSEEGSCSRDIMIFLKHVRTAIFQDGITLGGLASQVTEAEVSRVFRPGIANHVVGLGQVLQFLFLEDFSNL